ncbi:MAG: DksA/TraR family C4-type zinc finger protein [Rhodospirillum sp.]|nr:DksA/TraR family C4-type zinc finger protein [Rhodospirillum sp.]MCF8491915.1 DksA/TraR family C4-type zinc finger protein [Rhodospirillum sp.]MCF8502278.1 DksA/TraR family C4-type zinc finger protein [Rhodospirillum sp.]
MAGGWTRDGAVQEQIDDSIADAVMSARARLPSGPGEMYCVECGEEIPEARRKALHGVTTCVACQEEIDRRPVPSTGINRRGSKDSQLK